MDARRRDGRGHARGRAVRGLRGHRRAAPRCGSSPGSAGRRGRSGACWSRPAPARTPATRCSSDAPVVTADVEQETRFRFSGALLDAGARAGVTAAIAARSGRWGVLGAHATAPREFAPDEVDFLRAVANVDLERGRPQPRRRGGPPSRDARSADGAPEPRARARPAGGRARPPPARRPGGRGAARRPRPVQARQRLARPPGRRRPARRPGAAAPRRRPAVGHRGAAGRRRVPRRLRAARRRRTRRSASPSASRRRSTSRSSSPRASTSSAPASASPSPSAPTPTPPTCCATPTRRCTARRSAAAAATSCSTTCCAGACCVRLRTENELRRGIDQGELRVVYQPIVELGDGSVAAVEALARWQHPERGLLDPVEFIPVAEDSGSDRGARRLGARRPPAATWPAGSSASRAPSRC